MLKKMLTRLITILLVLLFSISCNTTYKEYSNAIIGTWSRTVDESIEPMPIGYEGYIRYEFFKDSAKLYPGSYEIIADYGDFLRVKLITNKVDYRIKIDKLILKYLVKKDSAYIYETEVLQIIKLNSDTLRLLRNDSITICLFRQYDTKQ